jgi:hypothetical protein
MGDGSILDFGFWIENAPSVSSSPRLLVSISHLRTPISHPPSPP